MGSAGITSDSSTTPSTANLLCGSIVPDRRNTVSCIDALGKIWQAFALGDRTDTPPLETNRAALSKAIALDVCAFKSSEVVLRGGLYTAMLTRSNAMGDVPKNPPSTKPGEPLG